jgi:hypothetical protein
MKPTGNRADIEYFYDFESIFATPEQEQKFISPYGARRFEGGGQINTDSDLIDETIAILSDIADRYAEGGQIEDVTDKLLRLLGDD